jgi:nucleoside-diphosphate-sugar epimerase
MSQKRLLVVGGTGFIGHHLCVKALSAGYTVYSLSLHRVEYPLDGVRYIYADLSNKASLASVLGTMEFEYVVYCGGYVDHRLFQNGGADVINLHFSSAINLIGMLPRSPLQRFVFLGSSDEYGSSSAPQSEGMRECPISPYSLAKVATTHFLQMLCTSEDFPAVILRVFLTYGPGQNRRRFIPQLINGCIERKPFPVSEGLQIRDFCFIEDVISGIMQALEASNVCGEVINLASGEPITIRSVIEMVCNIVGSGSPEYGKISYRPGESLALYADISKAQRLLNWHPIITLKQGLINTIKSYQGS